MIPKELISEIENRANIVDIISEYVQLKQRGDRYWGLSPFKQEKTPSFCVRPSHNMYYCFSTQKGGNIFKFIMEMEGLNYPESIEFLAKRLGIEIRNQNTHQFSQKEKERSAFKNLYKRITESFHFLLLESPLGKSARQLLEKRGIENETINAFSLGYSHPDPYWLHAFLGKHGFSNEFLHKTSLFSSKYPNYCLFHNRVIFPIRNHYGETIGFGGRALGDNTPKYLNSPDSDIYHKKNNVYGIDIAKEGIRKHGCFILCEGYFDVLAFHQLGIPYAVAPLGTACTKSQVQLLGRYAQKGIIVFDGDEAGTNAAVKAAITMEEQNIEISIVQMELNTDPADLLLKNSSQELKKLLSLSINSVDFICDKALEISDVHSPSGKERIVDYIIPYLRSINSSIRLEASIQIVADRLALSVQSIKDRFYQGYAGNSSFSDQSDDGSNRTTGLFENSPELLLMCVLVIFPEYFGQLRPKFENGDYLRDKHARELYSIIEDAYRKKNLVSSEIIDQIQNEKIQSKIQELIATNEFGSDIQVFLNSLMKKIYKDRLRERQGEIELQLRIRERNHDTSAIRELLSEKVYIDSIIEEN